MIQAILRFILGGALIALLPMVSQQFGPAIAGVALLFPAVTLSGLYVLGQTEGSSAMAAAAGAAVLGLPTVLAFLLGVRLGASAGLSVLGSLAAGVAAWFIVAVPTAWWLRRGIENG